MSSREILIAVAAKHGFAVADLTGKARSKPLWAARREAVIALRADKFSFGRIAHLLNRGKSTVEHYMNPRRELAKSKRRYLAKNGKSVRLDPEITRLVTAYAGSEGIGIADAANALLRGALEARA